VPSGKWRWGSGCIFRAPQSASHLGWSRKAIRGLAYMVTDRGPQRQWMSEIGKVDDPSCICDVWAAQNAVPVHLQRCLWVGDGKGRATEQMWKQLQVSPYLFPSSALAVPHPWVLQELSGCTRSWTTSRHSRAACSGPPARAQIRERPGPRGRRIYSRGEPRPRGSKLSANNVFFFEVSDSDLRL